MSDKPEAQPSLIDTLRAAHTELETEETAGIDDTQATIPDPDEVEKPEAEAGAEGEEAADGESEATDEIQDTETGDDDQPLTAPEHWSDDDKQVFVELNAGAQEFLLRRHREMEADYTRKTQEIAEKRKAIEPLEQVIAPHRTLWQQFGLDDATAVSRLVTAEATIRANPVQGIAQLMQNYGVTREHLYPDDTPSDYQDPATQALQQRIDQLEGMMNQQNTQQYSAQQQTIESQITAFRDAQDSDGNPLRPYFSDVEHRMAALINAERQLGSQLSLENAYDQAIRLDPQVRAKVEVAEKATQEAELERKARERAAKAKRAAKSNVKSTGTSGGKAPDQPTSIKEGLRQMYAELGGN